MAAFKEQAWLKSVEADRLNRIRTLELHKYKAGFACKKDRAHYERQFIKWQDNQ